MNPFWNRVGQVIEMITGEFTIKSLEGIETINQDMDVGVVRVSSCRLQELGARNSLVRVSIIAENGSKKSLIRIVRAKTGEKALKNYQIALQYDDRLALGIKNSDESRKLSIEPVREWLWLPSFLLWHTSPLVKKETRFALALLLLGFLLGFLVPSPLG